MRKKIEIKLPKGISNGLKKTLKGYLLGFISATLLVGCITAFATNTTTLYDVITNGVKIVVDGRKLNPTDANGKTVEPMIYNGTTYLPVRAVANALGKAVYWDGPNYTVYLGDMDGKLEFPTVELEDMVSVADKANKTHKLTDNYGNSYSRGINHQFGKLEFLLNMKYEKFKGTLYIPEGVTTEATGLLRIIADGKTIYTSPEMTRTSAPVPIDVNVTGYNDVKIEFSMLVSSWNGAIEMCLGDAGFYQ